MERVFHLFIMCFELTIENIRIHKEAATKLTTFDEPSSFREAIRYDILKKLLDKINGDEK